MSSVQGPMSKVQPNVCGHNRNTFGVRVYLFPGSDARRRVGETRYSADGWEQQGPHTQDDSEAAKLAKDMLSSCF